MHGTATDSNLVNVHTYVPKGRGTRSFGMIPRGCVQIPVAAPSVVTIATESTSTNTVFGNVSGVRCKSRCLNLSTNTMLII